MTWTAGCTEAVGNSCFVDRTAVDKTDQSTLTRGTVRISMNSPQTLVQLAGKRFTFMVIRRCSGKKATTTYSVKINDRGRIDRRGSDLDGDGRPDGS